MDAEKKKVRGTKRAALAEKRKRAPIGGGFAAAAKRARVSRGYQGVPRALKSSVKKTGAK